MRINKHMIKKALPTILTVGATIGTVVTAVVGVKTDPDKLKFVIREELDRPVLELKLREPTTFEKIKPYIPVAVSAAVTMGCIWGAHIMSKRELAAVGATCAYLIASKETLEKKLIDQYGEDAVKELKAETAIELAPRDPETKLICASYAEETGNGDLLCIEGYSGRMFRSSMSAVDDALARFNQRYLTGEYMCLNDLYHYLGILETHFGWQYGWPASDDYLEFFRDEGGIMFETTLIEDPKDFTEPVYCIDIRSEHYPMECWLEI